MFEKNLAKCAQYNTWLSRHMIARVSPAPPIWWANIFISTEAGLRSGHPTWRPPWPCRQQILSAYRHKCQMGSLGAKKRHHWILYFSLVHVTDIDASSLCTRILATLGVSCVQNNYRWLPVITVVWNQMSVANIIHLSGCDEMWSRTPGTCWLGGRTCVSHNHSSLSGVCYSHTEVGNVCVDPRFHPTLAGWNLGWTRKCPNSASYPALSK